MGLWGLGPPGQPVPPPPGNRCASRNPISVPWPCWPVPGGPASLHSYSRLPRPQPSSLPGVTLLGCG